MTRLYPMLLEPVLKTTLWGGRKLESLFGKSLPPGEAVGETWELADHPHGTSRVAAGPLKGWSLRQVVEGHAEQLFGPGYPEAWRHRFPLLVKIIDAAENLSVQVHPDERYVLTQGVNDLAKTECWVILQADPGARVITGVCPGVAPADFARAAREGSLENMLISQAVQAGDVLFVPAGRLHAIGAGTVLAEFQQPSDTTYRVYDWGRTDAQGHSRQLHLEQAIACINFSGRFSGSGGRGVIARGEGTTLESLVERPEFTVLRAKVASGVVNRRLDQSFECAMIIEGEGEIVTPQDSQGWVVRKGQTVLIPAACSSYDLRSSTSLVALLSSVPRP